MNSPEKIGIGTYQVSDPGSMLADIDLTGAHWFYTWGTSLPSLAVSSWGIGSAATLGGAEEDAELILGPGSDAWAWQSVSVAAGQSLSLSFTADALAGATGGVVLEYKNASGGLLGKTFVPIADAANQYLAAAVVPAGTVTATLFAYTKDGAGLSIDDVSIRQSDVELLANGGFELFTDTGAYQDAFTPMVWGTADMEDVRTPGFFGSEDTLLTFNEPDNRDQANLSVGQALAYWPELMATGMRLGSPAATTAQTLGTGSWLGSFMSQAEAKGYRVDFVAVHYYSTDPSVAAFRDFLEKVHEAYDRPIWVTEWALADWGNPDRYSVEQQRAFFEAATLMLDELPFVERHSWFGMYDGMDSWNINTALVDAAGNLTAVGKTFAELAQPIQPAPVQKRQDGTDGNDEIVVTTPDHWTINGLAGSDLIRTLNGDDVIDGGVGDDRIFSGGGNDVIIFGRNSGQDMIDGGEGNDVVQADRDGSVLYWGSLSGVEAISGAGHAHVEIAGSSGNDVIDLHAILVDGIARVSGGDGDDRIVGSTLVDTLTGNKGADQLWGGDGNDSFRYSWIGDSRKGSGVDIIQDFETGEDRIDLSKLDASTRTGGDQAFTFIGEAAFGNRAGELRVEHGTSSTSVVGDINGDGREDLRIELSGYHQLATTDFFL